MSTSRLRAAVADRVQRWARRRQGPDSVPLILERRRIYILPTKFGVAYALTAFAMLLGSMNYNNSLGLALTFLLVGLGLVAMHHCHRNLAGLVIAHVQASEAFAGGSLKLALGRENPGAVPRCGLRFECLDAVADLVHVAPRRAGAGNTGTASGEARPVADRPDLGEHGFSAWPVSCLELDSPARRSSRLPQGRRQPGSAAERRDRSRDARAHASRR